MTRLRLFLALLSDFAWSVKGIPSEVARWWRDGHTRTAWLRVWEGVFDWEQELSSGAVESQKDYRLWRWLGTFSDVVLILMVTAVIVMEATALLVV